MNLNELDLHDMVPGSNDIMVRSVHWLYCRSPLLIKSIRLRVQETEKNNSDDRGSRAGWSSALFAYATLWNAEEIEVHHFAVAIIPLFAVSLQKGRQQAKK